MALALAVSLWIGSSGFASADGLLYLKVDNNDELRQNGEIPAGATVSNSGKTLTITEGASWDSWVFNGGRADSSAVEGYTLNLSGVQGTFLAEGGNANNKVVSGNTVDGTNIETNKEIRGGISHNNQASSNTVLLKNSTVGSVYGSDGSTGANNSSVTLENTTVNESVYGGRTYTGTAIGNTVTLKNSTITNYIYGGYNNDSATDVVTGNTLDLFGTNTVTGQVTNFETINLKAAEWGKPVLTLSGTGIMQNQDGSYATIDTRGIAFSGVNALSTGQNTILIKNKMTGYTGEILSGKYKVGSTLEGLGTASLSGDDLIYTIDTGVSMTAQEQTHNTVMGATASMAALSAGNDFVGAATEGLSMAGNTGTDGMATYANMGGGSMNVETGSHVKTHTWNAILAIGHKNEKKLSTTEYGAFFEYGTGNYSTFNGDERGDGSTRYTGGGILGKWQKNNGFYVEGSLRAGSIHDDANNVLRDAAGNPYSYTTDATYWGAHIGVGREIKLNKMAVLDLYAKYFYNHRGSVSFDAGGHYDLGAVESSVLRVGTRYTVKQNDNINYYGGLAVEHEFCGRASGFADGVAIRGADISGTSVRGEIGAKFKPDEKSNVTLDLNLSGFAGKKQGLTGGLSAVFHI